MDPLTHGLLGAAAGSAIFAARLGRWVFPIAIIAGMAPDLDILIRSESDRLLGMVYHRHFTHALLFVPIGAAVAMLPFMLHPRLRAQAKWVYLTALVAYATHGFLDCLTSYGTLWFWPFSQQRVAWDTMSIIDPILTGILLLGVILAWVGWPPRNGSVRWPVQAALVLGCLYMGLGVVQNQRGLHLQAELAEARGHVIERGRVLPTLGNLILWRSIYEHQGRLYADALRLPLGSAATVREGQQVDRYDAHRQPDFAQQADARGQRDMQRLEWFADGYLARTPDHPQVIGDMRYSLLTEGFVPMWGMSMVVRESDGLLEMRMVSLPADRRDAIQRMLDDLQGKRPPVSPPSSLGSTVVPVP